MVVRGSAFALLLVLLTSGCTAYQRVAIDGERLHQELRAGNVARIGDWVEVTLVDGSERRFRVTGIGGDTLLGDGIEVPIDDIAQLAARDFSPGRTGALVGGMSVVWVLLVVALSSVTFMM